MVSRNILPGQVISDDDDEDDDDNAQRLTFKMTSMTNVTRSHGTNAPMLPVIYSSNAAAGTAAAAVMGESQLNLLRSMLALMDSEFY